MSRERAMGDALRLLSYRSRSKKELEDALKRKGHPLEVIEEVMAYLRESGYLNDQAFAGGWAAYRKSISKVGSQRLMGELIQRGIDPELAQETVARTLTEEEELERALGLVEKKWGPRAEEEISRSVLYGKIGRFLTAKGFPSSIVHAVLDVYLGSLET